MKKSFSVLIIVALILPCFAQNIIADAGFTEAEAEALLVEAYQRFVLMQDGMTDAHNLFLKDDYIETYAWLDISYKTSSRGEVCLDKAGRKQAAWGYIVTDPRFDTMEKCYDYAEEIFTEDWARLIVEYSRNDPYGIIEAFRTADGDVIIESNYSGIESGTSFKDTPLWQNYKVAHYGRGYSDSDLKHSLYAIGDNFSINGDTATLGVTMKVVVPFISTDYFDKEVTFKKTAKGWRVSGGSFFETMMFRYWEVENPLTSDPAVPTVAILGTVAVISLALPVVIYKRRRRAA